MKINLKLDEYELLMNLTTKDWGGSELSNNKQGLDNALYHHVKIISWPK